MGKIAINIATGSLQQNDIIVGIDLGTTNSIVAIIHPESKQPVALKEHNSSALVPSVVYFDANDNVVVGDEAKAKLITEPERTIFSAKRLMGKTYTEISNSPSIGYKIIDDEDKLVKVQVGNKFYTPIDLSALILKQLKAQAEHILKTPITKAVVTVPAYFNDAQRQATRDAGRLAGLDVLRIINEPTAASLAYGFGITNQANFSKTIAVYDLGGGTFDISILNLNNGIFEVLATNGDTTLGGDDFDQAIVAHWLDKYKLQNEFEINSNQLRIYAEQAKKYLSSHTKYVAVYTQIELSLTTQELNEVITPILSKTITCCAYALRDSGITKNDIDEVIMVGGSTRTLLVKQKVKEFFGKPINDTVNPDEVVALGAAIQADILAGNTKNILLLDVTPLSLGIETMGGLMDVLMPRNTKIPSKAGRQYTTYKDGQSGMNIAVYQGERDMVTNNRKLAEFTLTGIPAMPAGLPKVEVSFLINADGILVVTAKELRSGIQQTVQVKPQLELTDEKVEKMLLDSMNNAQSDIALRALTEAKTEGEQLLQTTEKFIQKNISELTQNELINTSSAMQALQLAIDMADKNLIQTKIIELNNFSAPYAERIMNNVVSKSLKGEQLRSI
jgi:molecular chaperone HscA